jgi:hypothetical protein
MDWKIRWSMLLVFMAALVLLVGTVSAGTLPFGNITLTYPDDLSSCNPAPGQAVLSGLESYHIVKFVLEEEKGGIWMVIGETAFQAPDSSGIITFDFNYPTVSPPGTRFFVQAEVYDTSAGAWVEVVKLRPKWTVSCSLPAQACSPGYWKQQHHYDSWVPTGYNPGDDFDTTFGVDFFRPNITLGQAAKSGGGLGKVARFGVSSLLGAAHPGVNFALTEQQVFALVQAQNGDALSDLYSDSGNSCPLN